MVFYKQWHELQVRTLANGGNFYYEYEGWHLLGVIPLYVRRFGMEKRVM